MSSSQSRRAGWIIFCMLIISITFVVWGVVVNNKKKETPAPEPPLTKEEYREKVEARSVAFSEVKIKTGQFPNCTVEEEGGTRRIRLSHNGQVQLRFYLDHHPMEGHKYVVIAFHKYKWNGKFWVVINGEKGGFWTPEYRPEGVVTIEVTNPSQLKFGWNVMEIVVPEGYGPQEFWNLRFHVLKR